MSALNLLKKIFIESQIFVSLCGTLLAVFFMIEQNSFRWPTITLVFITYFSGYTYTKFQHSKFFKKILMINFLAGIVCGMLIIYNQNLVRLYKWVVIVVLGLLYNSKFLENYVRKIPLFKVFYVGLVWALVNSWLSFREFDFPIFLISFLFVTALVLPFDIRDMNDDEMFTFPKLIGVQNTKFLAYILVFISCLISIFHLKTPFAIAFFLTSILTFFFIYFSENTNSDFYFSFGVESCSLLPFLFLVFIK